MLTKKQHELLLFINDRLSTTGISPSFEEMKSALNLKSKSGIHRLITALVERQFIRRLPHKARALEVIRMPEMKQSAGPVSTGNTANPANVVRGNFKDRDSTDTGSTDSDSVITLPLYGRIAAGTPIEALRDTDNMIDVPAGMLSQGDHYALEVAGDSMIDAGILDGDIAIIKRCDIANNGDIVVALVDDREATLKRLRRKGQGIALEPANPNYETRIFGPDQVAVQGRLAAIYRRY